MTFEQITENVGFFYLIGEKSKMPAKILLLLFIPGQAHILYFHLFIYLFSF